MRHFFALLFFLSPFLGYTQDSLKVDFSPGEFLSWTLTEKDFETNIASNDKWALDFKEYNQEDKLYAEFFAYKTNIFLTAARYKDKKGSDYFYALNIADGSWILKLLADLLELEKSGSATIKYEQKSGHFLAYIGSQKIHITFGKSMFTVFVVPTAER